MRIRRRTGTSLCFSKLPRAQRLAAKTCGKILQTTAGTSSGQTSTGHSTPSSGRTVNESTAVPDSPAKCDQVGELDEHHMTQCIQMIAGKTAETSTICFDGKSELDSASNAIKPVAVTGCGFTGGDGVTRTVLFVQFASIADRDLLYGSLSKGGTTGTWSQGGWAGTSASSVPTTGTAGRLDGERATRPRLCDGSAGARDHGVGPATALRLAGVLEEHAVAAELIVVPAGRCAGARCRWVR